MSVATLDSVRSDEVLPARVLARRLGWGRHTLARARREGLRPVRYGRCAYFLGRDVVQFLERVAEEPEEARP